MSWSFKCCAGYWGLSGLKREALNRHLLLSQPSELAAKWKLCGRVFWIWRPRIVFPSNLSPVLRSNSIAVAPMRFVMHALRFFQLKDVTPSLKMRSHDLVVLDCRATLKRMVPLGNFLPTSLQSVSRSGYDKVGSRATVPVSNGHNVANSRSEVLHNRIFLYIGAQFVKTTAYRAI